MKIVSWNCNGGLRKKTHLLDALNADLLIIHECENPASSNDAFRSWAGSYLWRGDNNSKGIGIFPKNIFTVSALEWSGSFSISGLQSKSKALTWSSDDLKLFLPFKLNEQYSFLACWTKGKPDQVFGYMGQFWKYLQVHRDKLAGEKTFIVGDFNSNTVWDKSDRWWNHSSTLDELSEMGIESIYHRQAKEERGKETYPTFYLHRSIKKPYHIDYAFASSDALSLSRLEIGRAEDWLGYSDHMPLILHYDG